MEKTQKKEKGQAKRQEEKKAAREAQNDKGAKITVHEYFGSSKMSHQKVRLSAQILTWYMVWMILPRFSVTVMDLVCAGFAYFRYINFDCQNCM